MSLFSAAKVSLCLVLLGLGLVIAAPGARAADKGSGYYRHGVMSMAQKNYDQAFVDFRKASELVPGNVEYQIALQRARFAAANAHIRQGEQLRAEKKYSAALEQMQRAQAIDPSNFVAGQEAQAIEDLLHPPPPPPGETVSASMADTLQERLARAAGPVELGPVADTMVKDFTVNTDPENAYIAAGKLAGLNVIFDNSSQGGFSNTGRVSLDLHNLSLLQILRVLNVETNSFYVPITPNTILVANNNRTTHEQVDPTVLKVFYVKNVEAPTDLTQLAQSLRGLMQPQPHIMPVASINALIMRDTPDKVAMVQRVLDDIDKAPPEVVVDLRILQITQDKARDLGLLPPTSFSIGLQATQPGQTTTPTTGTGNGTGNGTAPTTTTNSPTLNELTHLNSHNFSVTIPNATLNMLLSDSNTHTIQEPQLRSVQGEKAELKIGQKIPVATGSFQPGVGGVGINPLVNTQFTYQDVGVNVTITPQIHGDGTVLLKQEIDISNVDGFNNIGGIQQPVIGNRSISHTIELRNNESSVLGGIMVNTVTHNTTGLPFLSRVPLFKYLFSSVHDETQHNEILIIMTPHIVHSLEITAADRRTLATGTQDDVQLRILPPATTVTPQSASAPLAPGSSTPEAPALPADVSALLFAPSTVNVRTGQSFPVQLDLRNAKDAYALTFQLNYDSKLLDIEGMKLDNFLSSDGKTPALVHREDAATGTAQVSLSRPANASGLSGSGPVLTITFQAKAPGLAKLDISRLGARSPQGAPQALSTAPATIVVH